MSFQSFSLHQLGWRAEFAQSLTLADFDAGYPARVAAVHGQGLMVWSSRGQDLVVLPPHLALAGDGVAVGDWVLIDHEADRVLRCLPRQSSLAQAGADEATHGAVLAANLDVLFVVSTCDNGFAPAAVQCYLDMAVAAGITPVVLLTRADLGGDVAACVDAVAALHAGLVVMALNARDSDSVAQLEPWLAPGMTVALVGAAGAGKSTLIAGLRGDATPAFAACGERVADEGQLLPIVSGAWLIDTPALRALSTPRTASDDGNTPQLPATAIMDTAPAALS